MALNDMEKSNSRDRLLNNVMSLQNTQKKQKIKQQKMQNKRDKYYQREVSLKQIINEE
jgi:hypothetical protein